MLQERLKGYVRVAVARASLRLGDGTRDYVVVTEGAGSLLVTQAGMAGELEARVELRNVSGVAFDARIKVRLNNTAAAVRETFPGIRPGDPAVVLDLQSAFNGRRLCENTVGLREEKGPASWRSPGAVDSTEWIAQIRTR